MVMPAGIGFSLEFEDAKQKLEELSKEYAALLAQYDELTHSVRPHLEAEYVMQLGRREHQLFTLQLQTRQLKREIALYQAAKNHGETVSPEAVQEIIETEFAQYKAQLAEPQEKIQLAEELHFAKKLSAAETKELKALYYDMVRKLHPDLNPGLPPKAAILWQRIVEAYKSWDWQELNVLSDMAYDLLNRKEIKLQELNGMEAVLDQQKKISAKIETVRLKTQELRSRPPFTYEELLSSPKAVNEKRRELDELKAQFEEHIQQLTAMRDELKGS